MRPSGEGSIATEISFSIKSRILHFFTIFPLACSVATCQERNPPSPLGGIVGNQIVECGTFERQNLGEVFKKGTLPETNSEFTPENWCLEYWFPFRMSIFRCELLVSGSVLRPNSAVSSWMALFAGPCATFRGAGASGSLSSKIHFCPDEMRSLV